MTTAIDRLAGEPVRVRIGGKEYKLSPPTARDMGRFAAHVKDERYAIHARHAHEMPADVAKAVSLQLLGAKIGDDVLNDELETPEGMAYLAWLCIVKQHPEVTLESLDLSIEDLEAIAEAVGGLMGGGAEDPKAGADLKTGVS